MCREAFEHDVEKRAVENLNKMVKFRRIKKLCCIFSKHIHSSTRNVKERGREVFDAKSDVIDKHFLVKITMNIFK